VEHWKMFSLLRFYLQPAAICEHCTCMSSGEWVRERAGGKAQALQKTPSGKL
jgi:hypothetical protein